MKTLATFFSDPTNAIAMAVLAICVYLVSSDNPAGVIVRGLVTVVVPHWLGF